MTDKFTGASQDFKVGLAVLSMAIVAIMYTANSCRSFTGPSFLEGSISYSA